MYFQDIGFGALMAVIEEEDNMALSKEEKEFHSLPDPILDPIYDLTINENDITRIGDSKMPINKKVLSKEAIQEINNLTSKVTSDGTTASYYELPPDAKEIQDLISYKDMNSQMGEIGRTWYRYGESSHSDKLREINKIIFYAEAEKDRLNKYCNQ